MKKYLILLVIFIGIVSCGITSNDESDKTFMEFRRSSKINILDANLHFSDGFVSELIRLEDSCAVPSDYDITTKGDTLIFIRKEPNWYKENFIRGSVFNYSVTDTLYFNKNTGDLIDGISRIEQLYPNGNNIYVNSDYDGFEVVIDTVLNMISFDSVIYASSQKEPDTLVFELTDGSKAKVGLKRSPFDLIHTYKFDAVGRCIVRNEDSTIVVSNNIEKYGKLGIVNYPIDVSYFNKEKMLDSVITYYVCNGYKDRELKYKLNYISSYKKVLNIDTSHYSKFTEVEKRILYIFIQEMFLMNFFDITIKTNNLDTTGYWYYDINNMLNFEEIVEY